jgi:hypothetical protein
MFVNIHAIQSYTWFMKQHLKKKTKKKKKKKKKRKGWIDEIIFEAVACSVC